MQDKRLWIRWCQLQQLSSAVCLAEELCLLTCICACADPPGSTRSAFSSAVACTGPCPESAKHAWA